MKKCPKTDKGMDPIFIKEIDRIYRINKIFSRFPDETVKTTSALLRKVIDFTTQKWI
jgi:hypothetical protein